MFPDKAKMVRGANALLVILGIAPVIYISIGAVIELGGGGFVGRQNIVPLLFPVLVGVSVANAGVTVLAQRRMRPTAGMSALLAINRVYLGVSLGAILSEAHSIYGLILTLLSGSIYYAVGFSLVAWASLLWVRARFKRNVANLPTE